MVVYVFVYTTLYIDDVEVASKNIHCTILIKGNPLPKIKRRKGVNLDVLIEKNNDSN